MGSGLAIGQVHTQKMIKPATEIRAGSPDQMKRSSGVAGLVGKAGQGGWARGVKVLQHVTTQPPEKRSELWWGRAALGLTLASF